MVGTIVKLINALNQSNQLLNTLLNDPLLSDQHKTKIEERISINRNIIFDSSAEREVNHA